MYVFYDTINKVKKKQRPNKVHNTYITYRIVQNNASHAVNIVKLIKFCKQLSYMHVLRYKKNEMSVETWNLLVYKIDPKFFVVASKKTLNR